MRMPLVFGDCEIDTECFELKRRGKRVKLEPKVFDVLIYLLDRRDRVVTKQELLDALWPGEAVSDSVLPRCVAAIRRAVGDSRARQRTIETAHGRGYRFVATLVEAPSGDAQTVPIEDGSPRIPSQDDGLAAAGASGDFIGRTERLERLRIALSRAAEGGGGISFLVGEPGIGKTRLAEEFAAMATSKGFEVFFARCHEGEGAPAYWPWVQILRDTIASISSAEVLRETVGTAAADLAELVPELQTRLGALPQSVGPEGEQARFRLYDSVSRFLVERSRGGPLLLVLDDLHWADASSLGLLRFFATQIQRARILVVATYRDVDVRRGHPLAEVLGALARDDRCERLALEGFDEAEIRTYLSGFSGEAPSDSLVATLHDMTEGNPFFLREIVHLLADQDSLEGVEPSRLDSLRLPQGVRDAIGRRLDSLSADSNEVLRAAAVLGRSFRLGLLGSMLEDSLSGGVEELLELLAEALDAGLVHEIGRGRYAFAHALTRQTLYEELRAPQRTTLHRLAGEALERDLDPTRAEEESLPELAHHFYEAAAGGDVHKSIVYSVAAAEAAHRRHAYDEAVSFYERAVEVAALDASIDPRRRAELLVALGSEAHVAGRRADALATLDRAVALARKLEAWDLMARAVIAIRSFGELGTRPAEGVMAFLHEALEKLPETETRLRSQLFSRLAHASAYDMEDRRKLSRRALALAEASGDPIALRDAWFSRWWATLGPDYVDERFEVASALLQLAERTGDVQTRLLSLEVAFGAHLIRGERQAVERVLDEMDRVSAALRQPSFVFMAMSYRTSWLINQGRFREAEASVDDSFAYGDGVVPFAAMTCTGQRFWSRNLRGDSIDDAKSANEIVRLLDLTLMPPEIRALFVVMMRYSVERDAEVARTYLDVDRLTKLPRDENWLIVVTTVAEIAIDLADRVLIEWLFETLRPYTRLITLHDLMRVGRGCVAYSVGLLAVALGRLDEAVDHLETAIEIESNATMAFAQVTSEVALAGALLRRSGPGDADRADGLLAGARVAIDSMAIGEASPLRAYLETETGESPFDSDIWRRIQAS